MVQYQLIAESHGGRTVAQGLYRANTEKEARKLFWASLTDEARNEVECIECVDETPVKAEA